jgi:hypothetical protein
MSQINERYLSRQAQARRYDKSVRTIERWGRDPDLEYPDEIEINGRYLRPLSKLERWEQKRAASAASKQVN